MYSYIQKKKAAAAMKLFVGKNPRSIVISSCGYHLSFQRVLVPVGQRQEQQQAQNIKTPTLSIRVIGDDEIIDSQKYTEVKSRIFHGLLGLLSIHGNLYIGVISGIQKVGFPRWKAENSSIVSSENVYKVLDVDFHSLDSEVFDHLFIEMSEQNHDRLIHEHPCGSLKKLFSDGTFFFSRDFDISNVLKNHGLAHSLDYTIDNQDLNYIWNANLISEIVNWRSRLSVDERHLADGEFFTFLMRGFYKTVAINSEVSPATITLISRISAENKQDSLELEGIDEDGKVSSFVETEIIVTTETLIFSYTQISGNAPLFWEVVDSQLLYGHKLKLTKSTEHNQAAFDRHFDNLASKYGVVSIVNLVKSRSESQEALASAYKNCAEIKGLKITNVEYNMTKTPNKLLYLLKQDIYEFGAFAYDIKKGIYVGKQTGVLRISSFNSIERSTIVEQLVSREVLELAGKEASMDVTITFVQVHDKLWSENIYWLGRTYSKYYKSPGKYRKVYGKLFGSRIKLYDPLHSTIIRYLKQKKASYTFEKDITIFAGTFNVSGKIPPEDIKDWICPKGSSNCKPPPDLYAIGLEEVVELTPGHMLSTDPYIKQYWEKKVLSVINTLYLDKKYGCVWSSQLGGVLLMLFISETEHQKVKHIEGDMKKTGFGGMTSNKGAVAVSFKYSATRFCLLVSHLAAGLENVEQRHNDFKTIVKNIRFSRRLRIKDHDAIIWMGDFNYRILMTNDEVRKLITAQEFSKLFEKDQLNQQMIAGEAFPYYHEMEIDFPPTYKFDPGTTTYDTSEKMRIPAWTDRILSRGSVLKQTEYGCAQNLLFSDHRPVYAIFQARVTVLDEIKKAALSAEIYKKISNKLSNMNDEEKLTLLNDGSLILDPESVVFADTDNSGILMKHRGRLPPPSSDQKKWWIGDGKQVNVILDVDTEKLVLNPMRNVNPFFEEQEGVPLYVPKS